MMLVLSRKETDKVMFPTLGITVEVLRIRGNTTRLGIDAPSDVPVQRHELVGLKSIDFASGDGDSSKLSGLLHAPPDVILLDMPSPRSDGPCLARSIRAAKELAPIKLFALSEADPSTMDVPIGPRGIDGWFRKPVDVEHLVSEITRVLRITTPPQVP